MIIRAISQEAEREVERNEQVEGGRAYHYKENQVAWNSLEPRMVEGVRRATR